MDYERFVLLCFAIVAACSSPGDVFVIDDAGSFDSGEPRDGGFDARGVDAGPMLDAGEDAGAGDAGSPMMCRSVTREDPGPPDVPRPIGPISGSRATTRRPSLRYELPAGVDGARVELCRTRGCATVEVSIDTDADRATPPAELAPGVWFWRVRAIRAETPDLDTSPPWEIVVPHRSTPVDATWDAIADYDQNGLADVVVGARYSGAGHGEFHVYLAGPGGVLDERVTSAPMCEAPFGENLGFAFAHTDTNGDGFIELVASAPADIEGGALVYPGTASGIGGPPIQLGRGGGPGGFGSGVAAADIDGDGYGDVALGTDDPLSARPGWVYVYRGGPTGVASTPAWILEGPDRAADQRFGISVAAGDLDADGFADLVVGSREVFTSEHGRAYVYRGSATGPGAAPSPSLYAPNVGSLFGHAVAITDANGDGYGDVVVGAYAENTVYLFRGSATRVDVSPWVALVSPDVDEGAFFGLALDAIGDFDADGFSDLAVGAPGLGAWTGAVHLYAGSATGLPTEPTRTLAGATGAALGVALGGSGDIDGDLSDDLAAGGTAVCGGGAVGTASVYRAPFSEALVLSGAPGDCFGGAIAP